ncbi:MAG: AcrR family transcriptional regulator [Candidatus Azotimanducaceae bacterium]|jgi:AcrR family transcriptional regulator
MPKQSKQYHHGDLAETLIYTTVQLLKEKGAGNLSLREVARIAGVSHGAPAHHFTDKTGLLTAVAIQGQERLAEKLEQSQVGISDPTERLITAGEAYVRFALSHPGHFDVMFQKEMITAEDPDFKVASAKARLVLETAIRDLALLQPQSRRPSSHRIEATLAALWSQVHGFSLLWQSGNFGNPDDPEHLTKLLREVLTGIAPRLDS